MKELLDSKSKHVGKVFCYNNNNNNNNNNDNNNNNIIIIIIKCYYKILALLSICTRKYCQEIFMYGPCLLGQYDGQ